MAHNIHIDGGLIPEMGKDTNEKRGLTRRQRAIMSVSGAAVALIAGSFGIGKASSGESGAVSGASSPATQEQTGGTNAATSATETANAETPETGTRTEVLPSVAELEISAELSREETARLIVERLNDLCTAGMNYETYQAWHQAEGSRSGVNEWSEDFIAPYAKNYMTALCGPDYASNPNVQWLVNQHAGMAISHVEGYLMTMTEDAPKTGKGAGDLPVYQYDSDFQALESYGDNTFHIRIREVDNNDDTNLVNGPNNKPSADVTGILNCKTKIGTDAQGRQVLYIIGASYQTLEEYSKTAPKTTQ